MKAIETLDEFVSVADKLYPRASSVVDGYRVRSDIPNTSSIGGYFDKQETLRGVRVVPMNELPEAKHIFYAVNDWKHSEQLAEVIKASREIAPLIVGLDVADGGLFIIEGAHRSAALHMLKAKEAPALIVVGAF